MPEIVSASAASVLLWFWACSLLWSACMCGFVCAPGVRTSAFCVAHVNVARGRLLNSRKNVAASAGMALPRLPPGGAGSFFSRFQPGVVERRRAALAALLQHCAASAKLRRLPEVVDFLSRDRDYAY